MPDESALDLARTLHARGERIVGVNGALPAARIVADELARLDGRTVRVDEHLRLFVLGELVVPPAPAGALRLATRDDAELTLAWFLAFEAAAAEQAGRPVSTDTLEGFTLDDMVARIDEGVIWLWEDESGERVHVTGANPPAYGVTRVGPVYTPTEHRGRGYASAAVGAGVAALPRPGCPGVSLHRPGQPDVEQDLRGARLPPRHRHGESARRVTSP